MLNRCRMCNRRKLAHLMFDAQVCHSCHDDWLKYAWMAVRGL